MTALYQIANDYAKLVAEDLDPEFIADTLEGMSGELSDKVEQLLAICKNQTAYSDALKEESRRFSERAKAEENRVASIKEYIANSLETAGMKSLKAGLHQVTVRAPSKSVEITDAGALPSDLVEYETTIKPDKMAIKHLLTAGQDVPGAQIKIGKPSLIIK
ncbi:siphovirus Gp157 family protein [Erwinia sp. 9145]|uniref:siphovirus Gp157 family protein n=1 Tax=Erwinia sp. 9145 TaxID=1500895 RepID=UPI00055780CC|nr:siphovirus Gp157 family protein [Erwinia sp. 9145]